MTSAPTPAAPAEPDLAMIDGRWPRWPARVRLPEDRDHVSVDEIATVLGRRRGVVAAAFGELAAGRWTEWLATPMRVRSWTLPNGAVRQDVALASLPDVLKARLLDPVARIVVAIHASAVFPEDALLPWQLRSLGEIYVQFGSAAARFDDLLAAEGVAEPLDLDGPALVRVAAGLAASEPGMGHEAEAIRTLWRLLQCEDDVAGLDAWCADAFDRPSLDLLDAGQCRGALDAFAARLASLWPRTAH